jgi:hypothetical protein
VDEAVKKIINAADAAITRGSMPIWQHRTGAALRPGR